MSILYQIGVKLEEKSSKKSWIILIVCHILAAVLFFSWYSTQDFFIEDDGDKILIYKQADSFWKSMDVSLFYTLNGSLKDSKASQTFWAVANSRWFDLVSAFLMIGLYSIYIFQGTTEERLERIKGGLYMSVCMIVGLQLFHLVFTHGRFSPTRIPLDNSIKLSEYDHITWKIKDSSKKSFPGDHSSVLFMIATFIGYYARRWFTFAAAIIAILFVLPRMVGGGHWTTDILVGGGTITLITCSWALCSPLQKFAMKVLHKPGILVMKICGTVIPSLKPPVSEVSESTAS